MISLNTLSHEDYRIIILILIRFCRHSSQLCADVANCANLLDLIRQRFICVNWPCTPKKIPMPEAIKLFRIICQSDRNLAEKISSMHVMDDISRYLMILPDDDSISDQRLAFDLLYESFNLFRIFFHYGLHLNYFHEYRTKVSFFVYCLSELTFHIKVFGFCITLLETYKI